MSMPGRRVLAPPMSDHRTMPSASAAARSTFARSGVPWARSDWAANAPSSTRTVTATILGFIGLVMFLGDDVGEVAFAAGLRFGQHRVGPQQRYTWSRR